LQQPKPPFFCHRDIALLDEKEGREAVRPAGGSRDLTRNVLDADRFKLDSPFGKRGREGEEEGTEKLTGKREQAPSKLCHVIESRIRSAFLSSAKY